MDETRRQLTPARVRQIAKELCELFQQQMDALQRGLDQNDEIEEYLRRRRQIEEFQDEITASLPRPV